MLAGLKCKGVAPTFPGTLYALSRTSGARLAQSLKSAFALMKHTMKSWGCANHADCLLPHARLRPPLPAGTAWPFGNLRKGRRNPLARLSAGPPPPFPGHYAAPSGSTVSMPFSPNWTAIAHYPASAFDLSSKPSYESQDLGMCAGTSVAIRFFREPRPYGVWLEFAPLLHLDVAATPLARPLEPHAETLLALASELGQICWDGHLDCIVVGL
jgi:hypothetical protein